MAKWRRNFLPLSQETAWSPKISTGSPQRGQGLPARESSRMGMPRNHRRSLRRRNWLGGQAFPKRALYTEMCARHGCQFQPLVFTTWGGLHGSSISFVRVLDGLNCPTFLHIFYTQIFNPFFLWYLTQFLLKGVA
jgi:hypothetical protein